MLVVVRCPECREASRVDEPALGVAVQCPRCDRVFAAIEEAELIAPGPARDEREARRPMPPGRTRRAAEPVPETPPPPPFDFAPPPTAKPEPDYDPHREPQGQLPASVLIGLALLPFVVPICWLLAPALGGEPPSLSIVTPLALAVSVSILCIAVIYTVDWTPGTRVKGVLVLVALSYFAGVGLYFLNKEIIDRVKKFFGAEVPWGEFTPKGPKGGGYVVQVPSKPAHSDARPLAMVEVFCHEVKHRDGPRNVRFIMGSSVKQPPPRMNDPLLGTQDWFDAAKADILLEAQATGLIKEGSVTYNKRFQGIDLILKLPNGQHRMVRLFVIEDRVFYLAVEGVGLTSDDELAMRFFESFEVPGADK